MDEPHELTPSDQALRARILAHCRWMHQYDPAEARAAYERYREWLPWIGLPPPRK